MIMCMYNVSMQIRLGKLNVNYCVYQVQNQCQVQLISN